MAQVSLRLPGTYNVLNSLAVSHFSELVVFSCARLLSRDCCCLSYFTHVFYSMEVQPAVNLWVRLIGMAQTLNPILSVVCRSGSKLRIMSSSSL